MGKEVSDYTAQKVKEGQTSLLKSINKAWLAGVGAGVLAGVLMAYVNWASTGRQEKLTEYIASSILFSSLIAICTMAGASLGLTHALKGKSESPKKQ